MEIDMGEGEDPAKLYEVSVEDFFREFYDKVEFTGPTFKRLEREERGRTELPQIPTI